MQPDILILDPITIARRALLLFQVGGNMVQFNSSHQCGMFTFRLRSYNRTTLRLEQDFIGDVSTYFLYDLDAQPIFILTGDQLELEYYGQPATRRSPLRRSLPLRRSRPSSLVTAISTRSLPAARLRLRSFRFSP